VQTVLQIPLGVKHKHGAVLKLVFEHPNRGARLRIERCLEQKPIEDLQRSCFFDPRLCGQLVEDRQGSDERRRLPAGEYTYEHLAPTQHVDNPSYVRWVLVAENAQFGYDASSFGAAHLTSLREHFRGRLQSIALRFRELQSKFLPFRSPVTGS
jgi:hypothetical protein